MYIKVNQFLIIIVLMLTVACGGKKITNHASWQEKRLAYLNYGKEHFDSLENFKILKELKDTIINNRKELNYLGPLYEFEPYLCLNKTKTKLVTVIYDWGNSKKGTCVNVRYVFGWKLYGKWYFDLGNCQTIIKEPQDMQNVKEFYPYSFGQLLNEYLIFDENKKWRYDEGFFDFHFRYTDFNSILMHYPNLQKEYLSLYQSKAAQKEAEFVLSVQEDYFINDLQSSGVQAMRHYTPNRFDIEYDKNESKITMKLKIDKWNNRFPLGQVCFYSYKVDLIADKYWKRFYPDNKIFINPNETFLSFEIRKVGPNSEFRFQFHIDCFAKKYSNNYCFVYKMFNGKAKFERVEYLNEGKDRNWGIGEE